MSDIVKIQQGSVQGIHEGNSIVFKGVPYAMPPVGGLRFHAPVEHEKWDELMICDHWPDDAYRVPFSIPGRRKTTVYEEEHNYSEDCLYLNIWVPEDACRESKLPVMVWLYGAGGSSHDVHIDGQKINQKGCILVSINYRIGIMGYFAHEELACEDEHGSTGNYGLMDILLALKWVRKNISMFGGNPDNVTVFGHSAGAIYTKWLIGLPEARGLFRHGISMSGGGTWDIDYVHTRESKLAYCKRILELAGWGIEDMMTRPVEEIYSTLTPLEENLDLPDKSMLNTLFLPSMDGWLVKDYYGRVLYDGWVNEDIDIMCGMLVEEWHNFPCQIPGGIGDYKKEFALAPVIAWGRRYVERKIKPVYGYFFDRHMPVNDRLMVHGDELPYAFGCLERYNWPWQEDDRVLSDIFIGYITNFAKKGDPNGEGLPQWRPFKADDPVIMHFTDEETVCEDLEDDHAGKVADYLLKHPGMLDDPFLNTED